MVDRFPEAFRRFEQRVDIRRFKSYRELLIAFAWFAGIRWVDSYKQNQALAEIGKERGFSDAFIPIYHLRGQRAEHTVRHRRVRVSRRKWKRRAVRIPKVKKSVKYYVQRGYSANRIQKRLKKRGIGIRRKTLLRYVREAKKCPVKSNRKKYTPKKYRRRK